MSHGSYVESPQNEANGKSGNEFHAGLDEIERRASAAVVEGQSIAGAIEADTRREAGAIEEERRASGDPKTPASGESQVGMVIKTGLDTLSESRSSAGNFTSAEAKGLGAGANARSIDADFTTMRKSSGSIATGSGIESPTRGRCLLTKANCVAKNLGEQRGTNVGTKANEENSAQLQTAKTQVQSLGIANQQVLAQVQGVRAQNAHTMGMTPGGSANAPSLENNKLGRGPAYISPEQAARRAEALDTSDGSESWA